MTDDQRESLQPNQARQKRTALEIVFILIVGLIVAAALITSLSYDFVSARAPIFVIIPLLLVIAIQFNRTRKQAESHLLMEQILTALRGNNLALNKAFKFVVLMIMMLLLIFFAGHYVGISVFMFVMLHWISGEKLKMSLMVSAAVTALLFVLFEYGFGIELHRGYLFSVFA
jgi:hypothetical protein